MAVTVPVDFEGKFDRLIDDFNNKFLKKFDKQVKASTNTVDLLGVTLAGIAGKFTVDKIIRAFNAVTDAAVASEESARLFRTALEATDSATENNIRAFEDLATALQKTSRYDDDLILEQIALAKQFGVTNKEAAKLIEVAVDLSAATGQDLQTSVRQLGQTLDGTAGRMAQQFPILQRLTAAQLRNGEAITLLGKQYSGAALKSIDNYKGRTAQLTNEFGNLLETLGKVITQNPAILESMKASTTAIDSFNQSLIKSGPAVSELLTRLIDHFQSLGAVIKATLLADTGGFIEGLKSMVDAINPAEKYVDLFNGTMDKLSKRFDPVTGKFVDFRSETEKASVAVGKFNFVTGKIGANFDESSKNFNRFASEIVKDFDELEKKFRDVGKTDLDSVTNEFIRNVEIVSRARKSGLKDQKSATELIGKLELKFIKDAGELRKKQIDELSAKIQKAYQNPINQILKNAGIDTEGRGSLGLSDQQQTGIGAGLGIGKNILQGREGARNAVAAGVGAVASAFLGPAGQIVGDIIAEFTKGPEHVRQMITEFADAIPEFAENIVLGIAEAIPLLIEKFPEIFSKIIDRLPEIIEGVVKAIPKIIESTIKGTFDFYIDVLGKAVFAIYGAIGKFAEGAAQFIGKLIQGAGKFIQKILEGAGRFIQEIIKGIGNIGGSLGGGGGLGGIGKTFGTISGGLGGGALGGAVGGLFGGKKKRLFKGGGGEEAGVASQLVIPLQIGNKELAGAIIDLQKLGFKLVPV